MSISSTTRKAGPYACNGSTVAFPFSFKVFQAGDVRVILTDTGEAESDLVLGTNYTVVLNADQDTNPGGTVTTVAPYAAGNLITLTSRVQNLQPVTLTNQGGFYPKVINTALDRLTILVQQVVEQVGRAVKTPISSGLTPDQLIADLYAVEANAGNSATAAADSAANAAASAAAAAATLDNFDDRYLGQKTADPTLDNDGNALQIGALYYNTVVGVMRVYTGTGWIDAATGVTSDDVSFSQAGIGAVPTNVQTKLREFVSVKDFGAKGDGDTDDTLAFQKALASISYGGTLRIPAGNYKLTDELTLHAGVTVVGDGAADNVYGAPPAYSSVQTYLWQATPGKSVFHIGGGVSSITVKNLAMGAAKTITVDMAPAADGRYGIRCEGSYPQQTWLLRFENLLFYNLERGLSVVDPYAQTNPPPHTYDWNCCPILMTNCRFLYPKIGLYIDTNNCDFSVFVNCAFSVPSGGSGVYLKSTGYLRFIQCAGGGASISNNAFFEIVASGAGSMDNITLEGCQAESLTQFIRVLPGGTNVYRFMLTCRDCIAEMGADIYLAGNVHLITEGCRWIMTTYIDSANVRVSSYDDHFSSGYGYSFLNGNSPDVAFVNFRAGPNAPTGMSETAYDNNRKTIRRSDAPTTGKHKVGDRVYNNSSTTGAPSGWHCVTAGDPGTWLPFGQIGYRTNAGSPLNSVTPLYVGEELLDTTNNKWYKSYGLAGNYWSALT